MKIELKSIKFSEAMSEETNAFTANLYVNGKKVGYCKNTGQGGCTDYNSNTPEDRKAIAEAETYCKALPKTKWNDIEFKQSLESVIDGLLEDWLKAKEQKKMIKYMQTGLVVGVPDANSYSYTNYKRPLSTIPKQQLQSIVTNLQAKHCTGGVVILNTNLEALGITI